MSKTRRSTARRSTTDAVRILDRMLVGKSASRRAQADQALEDAIVGHLIYEARVRAKLTQKQLADLVGTNQAVISRLEDADYRGHSLAMLRRVASALGKRVEIRLLDAA